MAKNESILYSHIISFSCDQDPQQHQKQRQKRLQGQHYQLQDQCERFCELYPAVLSVPALPGGKHQQPGHPEG